MQIRIQHKETGRTVLDCDLWLFVMSSSLREHVIAGEIQLFVDGVEIPKPIFPGDEEEEVLDG